MPTGIATNAYTQLFFAKLVEENRLKSLYDFINTEKLFDIDSRYKFCLLTAGHSQEKPRTVHGGFYLTRLDHLLDPNRIYTIRTTDFLLINPNTKNCPIFRTAKDAELTAKIYRSFPIMDNEQTGESPWGFKYMCMFHMANDSNKFNTQSEMLEEGAIKEGYSYWLGDKEYVPLYEGKLFWNYNHHFGDFPLDTEVEHRPSSIPPTSITDLSNPNDSLRAWYWVDKSYVENRMIKTDKDDNILWQWAYPYYILFRDVTNATNERTCVSTLVPGGFAAGDKAPIAFVDRGLVPGATFVAMLCSMVFDYMAKQKVGGSSMASFIMKQMPVLTPEQIEESGWQQAIVERVARLCWFNHDLDGWMEELREEAPAEFDLPTEPVIWDEGLRAVWQAELDAIFAYLYGLSTEDLRYILDPEDVCGKGCINETFRVLKDRELRELGEYRTKRLVLEAWNKFGFDK